MQNQKNYEIVLFICRIQPLHKAHIECMKYGLSLGKRLIVLIGSTECNNNLTNPFSFKQRLNMIFDENIFSDDERKRITVLDLPDTPYNMNLWINSVLERVKFVNTSGFPNSKIAILSSNKNDDNVLRAEWFPFYDVITHNVDYNNIINATDIRNKLYQTLFTNSVPIKNFDKKVFEKLTSFQEVMLNSFSDVMHKSTIKKMYIHLQDESKVGNMPLVEYLFNEYKAKVLYSQPYDKLLETGALKYPVQHMTVDTVVYCAGHILLIKRKNHPGAFTYALPGGFKEINETCFEGALRELKEETRIDVPLAILRNSLTDEKIFDHPQRSNIGTLITMAYFISLPQQIKTSNGMPIRNIGGLPKVKGSDDAESAQWIPINDALNEVFHDDHLHIIKYFLGRNANTIQGFYK